jgi:poly(hydroxyalkanoate) granule-associated protein
MVRKTKTTADAKSGSGNPLFDSTLASSVRESAQQIWLAGMGAFAKAQAEGKQVFESLVKEGTSLQKRTQDVAEGKFEEVTSRMTSMADDVTARAGKQWDKLESIFEERTAKALQKLGVPTAKDVQGLKDRIDALQAQLRANAKAAARTTAAKTAARTSAKAAAPARSAAAKRSRAASAKKAD